MLHQLSKTIVSRTHLSIVMSVRPDMGLSVRIFRFRDSADDFEMYVVPPEVLKIRRF
jgi:hypothetical protein